MPIPLLDDLQAHPIGVFSPATRGKRFANYLIDMLVFYFIMFLGATFTFWQASNNIGRGNMGPDFIATPEPEPSIIALLSEILIPYVILVGYYIFSEYVFKGKTMGKLITGTRAVTEEGQRMSLRTVVKRSLIRIVPFEAFSFFGDSPEGWHDRWSKTLVVDERT